MFGPHGYRIRRKLKLSGLTLQADGSLLRQEQLGPPSFQEWSRCYRVLRTALIELDEVCPANLDAYHDHMARYASRYGSSVWLLQYQADVRARLEHAERLRRAEHSKFEMGGAHRDYRPEKPWNCVWRLLTDDLRFWKKELEEPALLVLARSSSLASVVDGDALTAASAANSNNSPDVHPGVQPKRQTRPPKSSPPKPPKQHIMGSDGLLTANRKGIPLCEGFQQGTCCEIAPGTMMICAKNKDRVHQCAKCLKPGHGAHNCASPPAKEPSKGKGKSRSQR